MKFLYSVLLAAAFGLLMRMLFGILEGFGVMSLSFLALVPFIIGFLTVYLNRKDGRISYAGAFFRPWITCLLLLFATIVFNVEGTICWIMIYPMIAIVGGFGGLLGNYFRIRRRPKTDEQFDWERSPSDDLKISLAALLLPLFVGYVEGDGSHPEELRTERQIEVAATPAAVWSALGQPRVNAGGSGFSLTGAFGFPGHRYTQSAPLQPGAKRTAVYEKELVFEETVTECVPGRALALSIFVDPAKVPPTTLDEHIVIGGKHVQLLEDCYRLEALPGGRCRITLQSRYRINTPFNWYAGLWAQWLMTDILEGQLALVKRTAEG